jgi:hypothetical protein
MQALLTSFHKFCLLCGSLHDLSVDHLYPKQLGGVSDLYNYIVLCRTCNSKKGNTPPLQWFESLPADKQTTTLGELVEFANRIHLTGEIPINQLRHSRCKMCNPSLLIAGWYVPFYYHLFVERNQEFLQHREDMCILEPVDMTRTLKNLFMPTAKLVAFDSISCTKAQVLACALPDRGRSLLLPDTKVIQTDKFYVRSAGGCYCEVKPILSPEKKFYIHEQHVHKDYELSA